MAEQAAYLVSEMWRDLSETKGIEWVRGVIGTRIRIHAAEQGPILLTWSTFILLGHSFGSGRVEAHLLGI